MKPTANSIFFAKNRAIAALSPDLRPWHVIRTKPDGEQTIAGEFALRREATRAIERLSRIWPNDKFTAKFTGQYTGLDHD